MNRFPPAIDRSLRLRYGAIGILSVLAVWWLITHPFFEEMRERQIFVESDEFAEAEDPVTGEMIRVRKARYETVREMVPYAIVNPPALDTPLNTAIDGWKLLTDSGASPSLLEHVLWSTMRILAGFLLSAAVAVPLGILMGLSPRWRAALTPIISFLRPLPSISWVPLALIWLGAGELQKLAIIFMGSFSAALIYTLEATLKVEPDLIRAALNLGASRRHLLWRVLLPAALPNILSGLKVVFAIGWTCVISAEIVGTPKGLGALIWMSKETSHTAAVLVGMAAISAVVLVLDAVLSHFERRLVPWMFAHEEES